MKRHILAAVSFALIIMPGSGAALASTPGYYFSGLAGVSLLPNLGLKDSSGTSNSSFDAGYAYGGAFGYDTGNGWRIEIDAVQQMALVDQSNGAPAGGHLRSTGLMVNTTVDLMPSSQFTPYVGAGLGFQDVGGTINGLSGNEWKPAYQLEGGLRYDMTPQISLSGEYRFTQSESAKLSDPIDIGNQHFSDHLILVGLTYHFGQN